MAPQSLGNAWRKHAWLHYLAAALTIAVAAVLHHWLQSHFGLTLTFITFYPATMLAAVIGGVGPGLAATFMSVAYSRYFLMQPYGFGGPPDTIDVAGLVVFAIMGVAISALAGAMYRIRARERALLEHALRDSEERFRMIVEGVRDHAIFMLDPDGKVVSWNNAALRITGWPESDMLGRHFSVLLGDGSGALERARRELAIAAELGTFHEENEHRRMDGTRFWADVSVTALRDSSGRLRGFAKVVRDISERVRTSREMKESRSRLASVVESAMDAIITIDTGQRIVLFNTAAETMFGYKVADVTGTPLENLIPARFRNAHAGHIEAFAATGVTSRAMGRLGTLSGLRRDGTEFPIEASISQATIDGEAFFTVILRDITERRRAEEHQSLLLRELAHRVKNTLAVVQSIAAQTRRHAPADQFQDRLTGRLAALGAVHDLLTQSEWDGALLVDVVRFAFTPYDTGAIPPRWRVEGPAVWLAPNEAVTLSLAFHELATNAAKYGSLSNGGGRIAVRWTADPSEAPTWLTINWIESGGPEVLSPSRRGFGSRMLETSIAHEMRGKAALTFPSSGVECRLGFPLSEKIRVLA